RDLHSFPTRRSSDLFLALSRTVPYTLIARANLYTERMILYGNTDCWPTEPRGYGTRCRTGAAPAWHASRDLPAGPEATHRYAATQGGDCRGSHARATRARSGSAAFHSSTRRSAEHGPSRRTGATQCRCHNEIGRA